MPHARGQHPRLVGNLTGAQRSAIPQQRALGRTIPARNVTPARLARLHADWDRRHASGLTLIPRNPPHFGDKNRPLRLGLVSPDLYRHPVAFFLLGVRSIWPHGSAPWFAIRTLRVKTSCRGEFNNGWPPGGAWRGCRIRHSPSRSRPIKSTSWSIWPGTPQTTACWYSLANRHACRSRGSVTRAQRVCGRWTTFWRTST